VLAHLGIALALLVLGRSGRMDNGCIHNRSGRNPRTALGFGCYQVRRAETCSWREVVEVLVITPAEAEGAEFADE